MQIVAHNGTVPFARLLLLILAALPVSAQSRAVRDPAKYAQVSGSVVSDVNGQPLARVRVYLKSLGGEAPSAAVEADSAGKFVFSDVVPGKYTFSAQRDGYLAGTIAKSGGSRITAIELEAGQVVRDMTFRLRPWSVIAGRIRFDDAEPAIGVLVQVFQDAYIKGRRTYGLVTSTRTNDRGEYRMPGLRPGAYYVAASYDRPLSPEFRESQSLDAAGKPLPQFRYATTFYPSAQKLGDALAIRVAAAEEATGIDIFLQPVRVVAIRGVTLSGLTGQVLKVPSLALRRLSGDERSSINAAVAVIPRGDGFEMRGVAAGPYLLVADTIEEKKRLFARVPVIVSDGDIEDIEVLLSPERQWNGAVKIIDAPTLRASSLRITLEPRSDLNPAASAQVRHDGSFTINVIPDETYDAYLQGAPEDIFIQSVRIANMEVGTEGIHGLQAGSNVPLEITISSRGGTLSGRAFAADGSVAPGAGITVVPDPAWGRPHLYKSGFSDQYGLFQIRGLAPGRYTAFVYYDDPPCELYDPDALPACRAQGTDFTATASGQTMLPLRLSR